MQTRRNFLQQGSALALGSLLLNKSVAAELFTAGKFPAPGLQLFTFFNVIEKIAKAYPPITAEEKALYTRFKNDIEPLHGDPIYYSK